MSTSIERRASRAQALVCIGLAATGAVAVAAPGSDPPSPPAATTRVRMAAHFEDLRAMQRLILGGDLDRVRERAREMVIERDDGEPATWAPYLVRMRAAAAALAQAESLLDACRAEARLARECAACHQASGAMPAFVVPSPPVDQPTLAARMARHQWAADRLWEGVVVQRGATGSVCSLPRRSRRRRCPPIPSARRGSRGTRAICSASRVVGCRPGPRPRAPPRMASCWWCAADAIAGSSRSGEPAALARLARRLGGRGAGQGDPDRYQRHQVVTGSVTGR